MNLIDEDLKLKILRGKPILLKKTNGFFIHRTVGEIIDFTYTDFLKIIQLFTMPDEEIQKTTPIPGMDLFMYFLLLLNNETTLSVIIRRGFNFFIGAENLIVDMENKLLLFSYNQLDNIELTKEGFLEIINYIKLIYDGTFLEEEQDLSDAEKRMKKKFDDARARREAAKGADGSRVNYSDMLGGYAIRNYNFNWFQVMDLPYYTFFFLLKKLRVYDDYDLQLKAGLAGVDMKDKKIHHWLSGDFDDD